MIADLDAFKTLVKARCGLLFEGNNAAKLEQALAERMEVTDLAEAEYLRRVAANSTEFQELVNLLTINETYFFREPHQLELLAERILPRFLARRPGDAPLRILSAGCSSGEEPYSLAMVLLDEFGADAERLFDLHAGDIDSAVLARARSGRYSGFSFRAVAEEVRDRHFTRDGSHYVLGEDIRRRVSFHELNLLADIFPPALRDFDLILFRNVSIYFDERTRRFIQKNLAGLLKAEGVLVTGTAETLANDFGILRLVEEAGQFYFAKGDWPVPAAALPATLPRVAPRLPEAARAAHVSPAPWPAPVSLPGAPSPASALASAAPPVVTRPVVAPPVVTSQVASQAQAIASQPVDSPAAAPGLVALDRIAALVGEHRYDEALPVLEQHLAADGRNVPALLLKAAVLLDRKDFAGAQRLAEKVVEVDAWSVDALLLLGLAAKYRGDADEAVRRFKQAIYTHHDCWPAHYWLADLHRSRGAFDLARREYRIVVQLLAGPAPDAGARIIPVGLPVAEVRFLCEHQLSRLDALGTAVAAR